MNNIQQRFDLCIVGGGLVGSALAIACNQLGLKTALVEQKTLAVLQPNNPLDMRHIALSHGSKIIFNNLDIWSALAPYTNAIEKIHVSDQGAWGFTRLSAAEQDMPALGYVIPYHDLQSVLSQRLQDCEHVTYFTDTSLLTSGLINDTWQLTLENNEQLAISAKLMIAADGIHSNLRTANNIEMLEKDYQQTAIVTTLAVSHPKTDIAYERFTQEGPIALLPAGDNLTALVWTVDTERAQAYLQASDSDFLQMIQQAFGYRVGKFTQVGKRQSFPLKLLVAQEQIKNRLLFLGSSVHNLHPIAAQGFNLALRDIAGLYDILKDNIDDIGSEHVLSSYLSKRKQDQKRTVRFTDGLVLLFSNRFLPLVKLRNSLMLLLDIYKPGKAWLGKYGAGRLGKLPSLSRGTEL